MEGWTDLGHHGEKKLKAPIPLGQPKSKNENLGKELESESYTSREMVHKYRNSHMGTILHGNPHSKKSYPDHEIAAKVFGPWKRFDQNVSKKNAKEDIH
jgi:hypothetical protein